VRRERKGKRGAARTERRGHLRAALAATVLLAVVLSGLSRDADAVWPPWAKDKDVPDPVYPNVTCSTDWLKNHLTSRGVVVVDARVPDLYSNGHIPGAISIPADELPLVEGEGDIAGLSAALGEAGVEGRGTIVCYGDESCSDAAGLMFWALKVSGAGKVMVLDGGYGYWASTGGDVETAVRTPSSTTWSAAPVTEFLASCEYVESIYGVQGFEIIDTRSHDDWEGPVDDPATGPAGRVGHIPHSLQFDFSEFVGNDGLLFPADECREIVSVLGPRRSSPVNLQDEFIIHGDGNPGNGAEGYYLLRRAGIARVKYFPAGWSGWSSDGNLPVVRFIGGEELKILVEREQRWPWSDSPTEAFAFLDVRHQSDHAKGHIPGSVALTSRLLADSLDVYMDRYWPEADRTTMPIVSYCYGPTCIRSRYTSTEAARAGFREIQRFYGGMVEWRRVSGRIAK
jgi:3-mercaptopyruvate sulfurtransferase SseA